METAELRKQDRLRAEDKMIAKEREREGDEFKDKEEFVTPSYLKQQEELRKLEQEEKRLEGINTRSFFLSSNIIANTFNLSYIRSERRKERRDDFILQILPRFNFSKTRCRSSCNQTTTTTEFIQYHSTTTFSLESRTREREN